ncbi:glycosyltransferase [Zhihengliuella halotolerans]|uniref:D-inositol 3-phosphate glycosyltransferase n=1 Tax=Zhihengliuella halotolerans TaxID=370736 RepID=A0A4V2G9L6_9MICC|nr:glycosyltransferase [Zhihengliuella halotolerans]RZU60826.1 glycosyltransferase involved in cell wall biosynthesis [Zhihengliuella halotolerans]
MIQHSNPLRVAHVTEAMGGGIVTVIASLALRQVEAGATVEVHYMDRPETPAADELARRFHPAVRLVSYSTGRRGRDLFTMARTVRARLVRDLYDAVHLHSSFAGAAVRLLMPVGAKSRRLFYSPHGWSFLREDLPAPARRVAALTEQLLARTPATVVSTCDSEHQLAVARLRPRSAAQIQTGISPTQIGDVRSEPITNKPGKPRVVTVARVCYQKAPWRFSRVADALGDAGDFRWIGGGEPADEAEWISDGVTVTGWISPDELARELEEADVFLFPSLWEGMPMALMQAQAAGIPCVVSDVVGNRDAVLDGVSGFVCGTDAELVEKCKVLLDDPALRRSMGAEAIEHARRSLTDAGLGPETLSLYRERTA